jgi:hypothetical protein
MSFTPPVIPSVFLFYTPPVIPSVFLFYTPPVIPSVFHASSHTLCHFTPPVIPPDIPNNPNSCSNPKTRSSVVTTFSHTHLAFNTLLQSAMHTLSLPQPPLRSLNISLSRQRTTSTHCLLSRAVTTALSLMSLSHQGTVCYFAQPVVD